ncbi:MAG TPA: serine/threonine-protein kinase [Gemmataceae bacterium]|nr:serine/threonine-protein kinase [Gemmataceae bacterium]
MTVDIPTFLRNLERSGLLEDGRLAELLIDIGLAARPEIMAEEIVARGWATAYQLAQVMQGRLDKLFLGQYRILDEVGKGSFGKVYRAIHPVMNRVVAVKVLEPGLLDDGETRDWFRREVEALTHLVHPNIVMAYDAQETPDSLFVVMEYVEGPNLDAYVRDNQPVDIRHACDIISQTCLALQYAHEKGIVHRDIKPANILLQINGSDRTRLADHANSARRNRGLPRPTAKVADFGLARIHQPDRGRTNTIRIPGDYATAGTPAFMAPEQMTSIHDADTRSDIYSLGCTFYYALTGRLPFEGDSASQVAIEGLRREAIPIEILRPQVSPYLTTVIRRMMAKNREERFQTPADVAKELRFLQGLQLNCPAAAYSLPSTCTPVVLASTQPVTSTNGLEPTACGLPKAAEENSANSSVPHPDSSWGEVSDEVPLVEAWKQWCDVVMEAAHNRQPRTDADAYEALYDRIMKGRQTLRADDAGIAKEAALHLAAVVEPWITLAAVTALDDIGIHNLLRLCRTVNAELDDTGHPKGSARLIVTAASLLVSAVLTILIADVIPRKTYFSTDTFQLSIPKPLVLFTIGFPIFVLAWLVLGKFRRSVRSRKVATAPKTLPSRTI